MGSRWFGIAGFLLLSVLMAINAYFLLSGVDSMMTKLQSDLNNHTARLAKLESPPFATKELSEKLDYLNTHVQILINSIADMELKLTHLKEMAAPVGNGKPNLGADTNAQEVLARTSKSNVDSTHSATTTDANADLQRTVQSPHEETRQPVKSLAQEIVSAPSAAGQRRWVINLASLENQTAADKFTQLAQSHGIDVQQQNVTVKGKRLWRIQVTGFASLNEARINARQIQEKLGLKDTWISQQH